MFFLNDVLSYTFLPHSIRFKTLIKEIPEEHQTCLAYHCLSTAEFWVEQPSAFTRRQETRQRCMARQTAL